MMKKALISLMSTLPVICMADVTFRPRHEIVSRTVRPLAGKSFRTCQQWSELFLHQQSMLRRVAFLANRVSAGFSQFASSGDGSSRVIIEQARARVETDIEQLEGAISEASRTPVGDFFAKVDSEMLWNLPLEKFVNAPGGEVMTANLIRAQEGWDRIRAIDAWASFSFHDPVSLLEVRSEGRFRASLGPGSMVQVSLQVAPWERCLSEPGWGGVVTPTGNEGPVTPFFVAVDVLKDARFIDTSHPDGREVTVPFPERQFFFLTGVPSRHDEKPQGWEPFPVPGTDRVCPPTPFEKPPAFCPH